MTDAEQLDFYRDAYAKAHARAVALEKQNTHLFEQDALNTEKYGMVCAERDRAVKSLAEEQQKVADLKDALNDMLDQFAYVGRGKRHTGGLSALEHTFSVLGLSDPHDAPAHLLCDEPGCKEERVMGTPTPNGYRSTCSKHDPEATK